MLLKAILKFCNSNELFEFKNTFHLKDLRQIRNLSAFKRILDFISNCAGPDWTKRNKFFQTLPNLSNLAVSNCSKNAQNVIQMALKWQFFFKKIIRILSEKIIRLRPQAPIVVTCSFSHNLHNQQLSKSLVQSF